MFWNCSISDVRQLFRQHQRDLSLVNLDTLVPHLHAHSLLTEIESYHLTDNPSLSPQERKMKLAGFMVAKGTTGLSKFLTALAEERQHVGHRDLLRILIDACKGKIKLHQCHHHPV